ncbi:hypothetical protein [Formosa sp. 4Alg 33]|uniref:hypothetical protein n=1 Tax=Formosa sp. 4Alg 33 TaxID=3382189 RepID=UPI003D9C22AA
MRTFLINIFRFGVLLIFYKLITFILLIPTFTNQSSNDFYGVDSNKHKIILVGSSNLEHNIDYPLLNKTFENYDVIGCNLNAPSGLFATLNKLKQLNPSDQDIIILCLPHSLYESEFLLPLKSNQKIGFNLDMVLKSFYNFPIPSLQSFFTLNINDVYDIGTKRGYLKPSNENNLNTFSPSPKMQGSKDYLNCSINNEDMFFITNDTFEQGFLRKINTYIASEFNSKIFYRYPAIRENNFDINKFRLQYLNEEFEFINSFKNSIYTENYWYNQWYHLNACGRDLNTEKLILEIKSKIGI